jgi:hypothetical protein
MKYINKLFYLLLFLFVFFTTPECYGTITVAKKAKFTGRVSVTDKAPNKTLYVWQSDKKGEKDTNKFEATGFEINTDGSGKGTVSIPNTASGTLLTCHYVTTSTSSKEMENPQTPKHITKAKGWLWDPWWASLTPGNNGSLVVRLPQITEDVDCDLLETWNTGTLIDFYLDPSEASWYDDGISIIQNGDLSSEIFAFDSQHLVIKIIDDPTINTIDDLEIAGLGITVNYGVNSVGGTLGWIGSSNEYIDCGSGFVFIESHSWNDWQYYEYGRTSTVPEPKTLNLLSLGSAGIMLLMRKKKIQ